MVCPMKRYSVVMFDATGTLFYPNPEPAQAYLQFAFPEARSAAAKSVTLDQMRARLKQAMSHHFSHQAAEQPTNEDRERKRWMAIVQDCLIEWDAQAIDGIFAGLWDHFADHRNWSIYEEVPAIIGQLKEAGYRIALGSNFDARLRQLIDGFAVSDWFDEVLVSSELRWCKPNVCFYDAAAQKLGLRSDETALMIGDTKAGDFDAAIKAGWDAALLVRDRNGALADLISSLGLLDD